MARKLSKATVQWRTFRMRHTDTKRPAAAVPVELLCVHWQRSKRRRPPHLQELRLSAPPMEERRNHDLPEDTRRFLALHGVIT